MIFAFKIGIENRFVSLISFSLLTGVLLSGCSLYENTDRQNFNSTATAQSPQGATPESASSSSCLTHVTHPDGGSSVEVRCEDATEN